jgi:hypothetical protein
MSKGVVAAALALLGLAALVSAQAPEIRRYLKIKAM